MFGLRYWLLALTDGCWMAYGFCLLLLIIARVWRAEGGTMLASTWRGSHGQPSAAASGQDPRNTMIVL